MKRIAIHKTGEEGAFHVDARNGQVLTPTNEMPEWASGYVQASLSERIGWYEKRLGAQIGEELRSPELMDVTDLSWVGLDEAGDEVEIDFHASFRTEKLAEILEIDTSVEGWGKTLQGEVTSRLVDDTYRDAPTDERTLGEVEGMTFSEEDKEASTG